MNYVYYVIIHGKINFKKIIINIVSSHIDYEACNAENTINACTKCDSNMYRVLLSTAPS